MVNTKSIEYTSAPIAGARELKRYAIGPVPHLAFHVYKYLNPAEVIEKMNAGLPPTQEIRPHPDVKELYIWGEWLVDTFMEKALLNDEQLLDIPDEVYDKWDSEGYIIVPWDFQYVIEKTAESAPHGG